MSIRDDARVSLSKSAMPAGVAPSFHGGSSSSSSSRPSSSQAAPGGHMDLPSTLDEPVKETIMRDLRSIASKIKYVMLPSSRDDLGNRLKDWDLWGPLLLCLLLGSVLSEQQDDADQASYAFADVFVVVWIGSTVVTVNAMLLKGQVSIFQTVCVLGYCIAPLVISAIAAWLFGMDCTGNSATCLLKVFMVICALIWSARASVDFVKEIVPEGRKWLGVYPVWLFYVAIAWMIMLA
eukprot:TRINITY_DN30947_c0_g2_i3.p1 TRINITY_DN30947_c0_g2~~TRINITY_DN30947_c0_g2_i3.p1  ORF type:complete len:236 (+),score=47.98 TRINITY_DN30947_c0_g2_i3:174-881(+)